MRRNLLMLAIAAGLVVSAPAAARDKFKTGSTAYTVGLYGSAARHWMALAIKGHAPAQYNVGRMLYYGQGVRRDPIEAYKWFLIARENGIHRSATAARILSERMTRRQVVEATARAREWRRRHTRVVSSRTKKAGPKTRL